MRQTSRPAGAGSGFTLVELMVTVLIAGIVFAAMVPLFVTAASKASGNRSRTIAVNAAQARIEAIRALPFDQIAADPTDQAANQATPNLYDPSFGSGQFGPAYTPSGSSKTYSVGYAVTSVPATGIANYKQVTVTVSWTAPPSPVYPTTLTTTVMNPAAAGAGSPSATPTPTPTSTSTSSPSPTPTPSPTTGTYTLTILVNTSDVTGISVVRSDVTPSVTELPTSQVATIAAPVSWTGLPGGSTITYLVTCSYAKPTAPNQGQAEQLQQTVTLTGNVSYTFDTSK
jgi:prepilin-type N-terminal cleavage/methylation domain-containing protein